MLYASMLQAGPDHTQHITCYPLGGILAVARTTKTTIT